MKPWSLKEWSFLHNVWIELTDVPPSAWVSLNLIRTGSTWGRVNGFDERTVRGEHFSCERLLLETNMKESIAETVVIVCDNHQCEVVAYEVALCPSAPCSLASFLEAAIMADFPANTAGGGSWKCNGPSKTHDG